jgi:hypothetical protein
MAVDLDEPLHIEPKRESRGERRRRSLRRGIDLWHVDTCARARTRRSVALLALTVADEDPMAARGAIRRFWRAFRERYGQRAYFSWAELQRRGAIHYHALIVNPPWRLERHARRWLKRNWPLSPLTPSYQTRDWTWFERNGGAYVKKYAKKPFDHLGARVDQQKGKAYQQDYDELPREIRTWECNRRWHRVAELAEHIDQPLIVNTASPGASLGERAHSWWVYGMLRHRPRPQHRCTLAQKRTPFPKPLGTAPHREDSGACPPEAPWSPCGLQVERSKSDKPQHVTDIPLPFG